MGSFSKTSNLSKIDADLETCLNNRKKASSFLVIYYKIKDPDNIDPSSVSHFSHSVSQALYQATFFRL